MTHKRENEGENHLYAMHVFVNFQGNKFAQTENRRTVCRCGFSHFGVHLQRVRSSWKARLLVACSSNDINFYTKNV